MKELQSPTPCLRSSVEAMLPYLRGLEEKLAICRDAPEVVALRTVISDALLALSASSEKTPTELGAALKAKLDEAPPSAKLPPEARHYLEAAATTIELSDPRSEFPSGIRAYIARSDGGANNG